MKKETNIKSIAITVMIAVLFILFFGYAINTWYPRPNYENFCQDIVWKDIYTPEECELNNGTWQNHGEVIRPVKIEGSNQTSVTGFCDIAYECRTEYDSARKSYSRNVAILLILTGIVSILFGFAFSKFAEYINLGFVWGGIITMFYGLLVYWNFIDTKLKPLLIAAILIATVYLANKHRKYFK